MNHVELRDGDQARRFLLEGLWCQEVVRPTPATGQPALRWALEMASAGQPLPPVGFIADLGHVALGQDQGLRTGRDRDLGGAGLPAGLARRYEDHVLGKLYADWQFERAGDALRRFQGRDQDRGVAFVLNQFRERSGFPGVHLSPAVIRGLRELPADDLLARGWETRTRDGLLPLLPELYEELIAAARRTGDVLGSEDIFELEHGTALLPLGQRVALRQLLQAADQLESALPRHQVRPRAGRQEVPTHVFDEDTYPVGGYAALANRGTMESLLQSQLAYMEQAGRPDLFDIKFLRDELLYYSRDENQFLRRRRTFLFVLFPDLARARFKDASLPWQRIVLLLALLLTAVRKLSEWLSTDALLFEFFFLDPPEKDKESLAEERKLLQLVFREQMANGTVRIDRCPALAALADHCARRARRSLCHCLVVGSEPLAEFRPPDTALSRLRCDGPVPVLEVPDLDSPESEGDGPVHAWTAALERLLQVML
jgi:hypothetical protein